MSARRMPHPAAVLAALGVALASGACHRKPAAAPEPKSEVAVGYGTASRAGITSAIGSIDGAEARVTPQRSAADMLRGRSPGVEVLDLPNGHVSIRIRGRRSFLGSSEPLVVVDGTPIQNPGALEDIDPYDIERIDVLKDAGATAVYGSRGANGVILISMKRAPKP